MVWLISFLTVSNIAMGYGLAVYFHRHYGTAFPSCGPLLRKKSEVPSTPATIAEVPTATPPAAIEVSETKAPEAQKSVTAEITTPSAAASVEEASGLPPVDEENVLAGIEEFRSQLAKMNVAAEESAETGTAEVEELAVAAS